MIRLFTIVLCLTISASAHAEWIEYAQSAYTKHYYNIERMQRLQDGKISVWVKVMHDSPDKIIKLRLKSNRPIEGFESYSYNLNRYIVDCNNGQNAMASLNMYSSEGDLLDSVNIGPQSWEFHDIQPNSAGEKLMKVTCASNN